MSHAKSAPIVEQNTRTVTQNAVRNAVTVAQPGKPGTTSSQSMEIPYRSKSDVVHTVHTDSRTAPVFSSHMGDFSVTKFTSDTGLEYPPVMPENHSVDDIDILINRGTSYGDILTDNSRESFVESVETSAAVSHDLRASESCSHLTTSVGSMDLDHAETPAGLFELVDVRHSFYEVCYHLFEQSLSQIHFCITIPSQSLLHNSES